jgi:hypothetical protein
MQVSGHFLKTLQHRGKNIYWFININFRPMIPQGEKRAKKIIITLLLSNRGSKIRMWEGKKN